MKKKINWKLILKIAIAVLTAIAGAIGMNSCKGLWVKGDGTHNYEYEYKREVKTNNKDYGIQNENYIYRPEDSAANRN